MEYIKKKGSGVITMGKIMQESRNRHQSGKRSYLPADISRIAILPGKRRSRSGKTYWETRRNRSDRNPKEGI